MQRTGPGLGGKVFDELGDGDRLVSVDYPIVWPRRWPGVNLAELYNCQGPGMRWQSE
tara:strand:+ start:188 stop:358 length:171 start_codon:yes stop_codon:yes gene_type:complete